MGIKCSDSQLLLLEVGGLVSKTKGKWEATIPILDKEQTNSLRSLSKEIAESMYVKTKADFISLAQTISEMGFKNNVLSLVFSYLLDGKMWTKLVLFEDVDNYTSWSGCYWVLYESRNGFACGTNGFGEQNLILTYDPFVSEESAKELGVKLVSFEELVCQSDYISVHCPLTAQTHHIVNEDVLRAMKKTAFLINTSRGATVDTEALYHACRDGEIAGAAIDVTEQEPLPAGSPLRTLNNLIITPHIAWYTEEAIATLKEKLAQEIIRVYEGGQPVNIVNRNSLKGMETK